VVAGLVVAVVAVAVVVDSVPLILEFREKNQKKFPSPLILKFREKNQKKFEKVSFLKQVVVC
jgi:hypothetical protein